MYVCMYNDRSEFYQRIYIYEIDQIATTVTINFFRFEPKTPDKSQKKRRYCLQIICATLLRYGQMKRVGQMSHLVRKTVEAHAVRGK